MKTILYHEFIVQNKAYNLSKYLFFFFSFCLISTILACPPVFIQKFGSLLPIIYVPIAFLGIIPNMIKYDLTDGNLEFMLHNLSALHIVIAKFLILSINATCCFALNLPLIYLFFNQSIYALLLLLINAILVIMLSAALVIVIGSIQCYFKTNTNYLSMLIFPLIIPSIILSGVYHTTLEFYILSILFGIDLLLIPPAIYLASYLVDNIYNI